MTLPPGRPALRSAQLRSSLLASGAWTAEDLAQRRGQPLGVTRRWLEPLHAAGEVLIITDGGVELYPTIQFTSTGQQRPQIPGLVRELRGSGLDSWSSWAWLTCPTGLLSDAVPIDLVETDPDRVARAAARYTRGLRHIGTADSKSV